LENNILNNRFLIVRRWIWVILGIFSIFLKMIADAFPNQVETLYSRGLYLFIRKFWDISFAYSPIPLFHLFWIGIIFFLYRLIRIWTQKNVPTVQKWKDFRHKLLSAVGILVIGFYFLWGFNYSRPLFTKQIGLKIQKIDSLQLRKELEIAAAEMVDLKQKISNDTVDSNLINTKYKFLNDSNSIDYKTRCTFPNDLEKQIRQDVTNLLNEYQFPAGGKLRGRSLKPNGILRRFGATGVYWPWAGECNMDNSLHPLDKPFTLAHELSHGYGWADEGTCNFLAYLSCRKSTSLYVQYAGYINYYRYIAGNYKRQNPIQYDAFRKTLPEWVRQDLDAMNANSKLYSEWFDTSFIYEKYLKSQGVKEGLSSYSRIVLMVHAWRIGR
jgi:Protein of unknown function (DUF3810)